ncbi:MULTISPECIES: SRPBCC family protein [Streptomyces]|uniref:SRPBCC family protein n=1 Tax=Streptomyces doudnae TaxID=3075536 RepID=A0ABD5EGA4_9ACTN|nr:MULTISPECIES: SRPBCC family protein [unclassified Streptomyces]MDT0433308.1 SRPBCC family protein [Streptomyces sp. DSM 41981]MYQ68078.1 SRPBCC family protein [Streptomyces sp. SID4950]SCE42855.1 Polyketide cyclase / dehydrase and lipid transport [Streptomyces sp. SolWspMP-5a-2]
MTHVVAASAERTIDAPADQVYRYLADTQLHSRFLPPPFYDFHVEETGAFRYKIDFAGGVRELRMQVTEPEPGRTLVHADKGGSGLVTTFTVTPRGGQALVDIASRFDGESGVAGFVERIVAPRRLHRVYGKELARLDAYAREQRVG